MSVRDPAFKIAPKICGVCGGRYPRDELIPVYSGGLKGMQYVCKTCGAEPFNEVVEQLKNGARYIDGILYPAKKQDPL